MMTNDLHARRVLVGVVAVLLLADGGGVIAQTTQEHVHEMAQGVMPFDLARRRTFSG